MKINGDTNILELKERFSRAFLGLKLEFYKGGKGNWTDNNVYRLKDLNPSIQTDNITWAPNRAVGEVEQEFEAKFGIKMQVVRDDWTIELQNNKGIDSRQAKTI